MASQNGSSNTVALVRALEVFLAVCTIVILIILYGAFASNTQGTLAGDIYVQSAVVERIEK